MLQENTLHPVNKYRILELNNNLIQHVSLHKQVKLVIH